MYYKINGFYEFNEYCKKYVKDYPTVYWSNRMIICTSCGWVINQRGGSLDGGWGLVTHCVEIYHYIPAAFVRGALKTTFLVKLGIFSQHGGVGLSWPNPNYSKTQTITIQNVDFVGILSQYGGVPQYQPKKSPKITNHKKMGLFHEQLICLE